MKHSKTLLPILGGLALLSTRCAPTLGAGSDSADGLEITSQALVVGGAECRTLTVYARPKNPLGAAFRMPPTYVRPGFSVQLTSPDGILTQSCTPNSPPLASSVELPSPRAVVNSFGRPDIEPRLSTLQFGFTPCRTGDVHVVARGPDTLGTPTKDYAINVATAAACCPGGQTFCNGACVDTSTDEAHCGGCGQTCTGGTCAAGTCGCPGERYTCVEQGGPKTSCCVQMNQCRPDGTCRTGDL